VAAFDRYEFLRSMLELGYTQARRAALGEFVARLGTSGFEAGEIDYQWPLVVVGGFDGDAEKAREFHVAVLQQVAQWPMLCRVCCVLSDSLKAIAPVQIRSRLQV
jgi:hypothetical protein